MNKAQEFLNEINVKEAIVKGVKTKMTFTDAMGIKITSDKINGSIWIKKDRLKQLLSENPIDAVMDIEIK